MLRTAPQEAFFGTLSLCGTWAWRPPTCKGRCRRPHETAPMHRPSPPSNDGRYGKPDASMTGSTHANHRSARSPRPTPEGPARDKPIAGPRGLRHGASPAPLPRRGPAAGTRSPVLGRPPRAPRSHPVRPGGERHHGVGKVNRSTRITGPDEPQRTTRGQEARQRGTPPATAKAHRQLPSHNACCVPQIWRAGTARNEPRHKDRCQATPAAVQTDVCTPGSEPSPCRLRNSRRPDGRVYARRVSSPCRLRTAAVRIDECAPGGYPDPAGYE